MTNIKEALSRIPRKGRVRFLLATVIAVAVAVKITGAFFTSSGGSVAGLPCAAGAALDAKGVARLLAETPPNLTCGTDTLCAGGDSLVLSYSLDTAIQNFAVRQLQQYRPKYGALAVMDPRSGRVLALVSYRQDSLADLGGRLCLRSAFPAASLYKTVTAAAAIEKAHFSAETMVPVTGRSHTLYRFQLKKSIAAGKEIPLKEAYAQSINPVFARIGMHAVGRQILDNYSTRFGFNAAVPFELSTDTSRVTVPDDTTYAMAELASGFNRRTTISPLHGALIASAVAGDGAMPLPRLVDSVCRTDGKCIYRSQRAVWRTPVSAATACDLRDMMEKVVEDGTCRKTFRLLRQCAWSRSFDMGGKTGSVDVDSLGKIDWFIGFAVSKDAPARGLAVAIVTVHGRFWTVHSSYLGSEIFRKFLRPLPQEQLAKQQGGRDASVSAPVANKPKG
jgi:penicillin-binding protein A